jgi:hypothetical protein
MNTTGIDNVVTVIAVNLAASVLSILFLYIYAHTFVIAEDTFHVISFDDIVKLLKAKLMFSLLLSTHPLYKYSLFRGNEDGATTCHRCG